MGKMKFASEPIKQTSMKWIDEFKKFAVKGNVIDMAVGIMIGTAFNRIVTSLVEDLIMPPIGYMVGGLDFANLKLTLKEGVSINYGNFLQILFNFIIIALSMFVAVKVINKLKEREERKGLNPPAPPQLLHEERREVELLSEIRDLLKRSNQG